MKRLIIFMLFLLLLFSLMGCESNQKSIYLEPLGYQICYVDSEGSDAYGYISNSDFEKYKSKQIEYIEILYPYKDNKQGSKMVMDVNYIHSINVGNYRY